MFNVTKRRQMPTLKRLVYLCDRL